MLRVNHLAGFGAGGPFLFTGGTAIGDMVNGGGLAAAFDGVTSQLFAASASKTVSTSGYNNFVGRDWGAGNNRTVSRFEMFAPSDFAILGGGGAALIRLEGSPDNTAWTVLYTAPGVVGLAGTVADVASGIDVSTAYRYHRVAINGNGSNGAAMAELRFYGV